MNDKNKYTIITCTTIVILFILKKTDSKKLARAQTIPKINKQNKNKKINNTVQNIFFMPIL